MKKILKVLTYLLIVILVVVAGFIGYLKFYLPDIKTPTALSVEITPERVERGRYLANELMGCVGCHATRDYTKFAGPIVESTKGSGGELWDEKLGFPGELYAPNITPGSLSKWTDAELFRAITSGVNKDGEALFPIMPYLQYGKLPKEDIYDVIAYIRTLEPTATTYPTRKLNFPLNLIVNLMPKEGSHHLGPDTSDLVKHGEYIITAAVCYDCHTPMEKGRFIEEMAYAGGQEFTLPTGGIVRAANLTPDKSTGIGNWTKEQFVQKFKAYADSSYKPAVVKHGDFNSFMPWDYYAQIKTRDLEAIYAYLMTLEPKANKFKKFSPDKAQIN
ncbi:MAG: cytochrome c [Bacteroidales bacterium]|nr:cytochrome c [Bacteroidales bacterium]MCF8405059.1 cytochrome c [Bacteroidales bacterium]